MTKNIIEEIKEEFLKINDTKYKNFSSALLPGIDNVIGIRLPILRKMAKEIHQKKKFEEFIKFNDDEFFELTMLEGMLIGYINDYSKSIKYIKNFIPKINNWSVCDSFCCGLKIVKKNKEDIKLFLEKYFDSEKEFELRFAYIILLDYFIESDFDYVLDKILKFNNDSYYSKMGVAWLLSICFVKKFDETLEFVKKCKIHDFVFKKGICKARESFRLSKEQKDILKNL